MCWFNKKNSSEEPPKREKPPLVEQYIFFTNHLEYLDGKMTELFKYFITLATAIIGGTFLIYLNASTQDKNLPLLALGADLLLIIIGFSTSFCILNRLRSWGGYRRKLIEIYDTGESVSRPFWGEWWISEVLVCMIIMATTGAFPYFNPLASGNIVPHWHYIQKVYGITVLLLFIYLIWVLCRLTSGGNAKQTPTEGKS